MSNKHRIHQCVLCLGYELRLKKQFSMKDVKRNKLQSNRSTPMHEINYWLAPRIIKYPMKRAVEHRVNVKTDRKMTGV